MAVIKPGALVADIRGKVGDNVFTRTQGGATVRSVGTWEQPDTEAQGLVQDTLLYVSAAWAGTLSQAQRNAWNTYALTHPRPNRWGSLTINSGYLAFIRHNATPYRQATALIYPNAPTAPPLHRPTLTFTTQALAALTVTGTLSPDYTGIYLPNGNYNGHPSWKRTGTPNTYLWWYTGPQWDISAAPGYPSGGAWARNTTIVGAYGPYAGATGTATVAWSSQASLATITTPPSNYTGEAQDLEIYLFAGQGITAGRNYYNAPWKYLGRIPSPNVQGPALTVLDWPYTIGAGHTAMIYANIFHTVNGAMSSRAVSRSTEGPIAL